MLINLFYLTLCWAVFALLYSTLLRKETFFHSNRFYLLGALVLGLTIPWLKDILNNATVGIQQKVYLLPEVVVGMRQAGETMHQTNWEWWIAAIWATGSLWMTARFIWGLMVIFRMVRNAEKREKKHNITLVYHEKAMLPFSFFHWVFIAPSMENDASTATMIAHEKAHANGRHTLDILFCEALCVLFWWNPLVYWYKNAIRAVHEYIADEEAAHQFSRKQYGLLLIRHAQSGPALVLANHFFQSPLKQRLVMLTKTASAPVRAIKYALVIPVFTFVLVALQQSALFGQTADTNHPENVQQTGNGDWGFIDTILVKDEKTSEITKVIVPVNMKPTKNEQGEIAWPETETPAEYPGGTAAFLKYISDNLVYPAAAKTAKVEGMVVISFVVNAEGRVESAKATKSVRPDMDEEAIRVISKSVWIAATNDGKRVPSELCIPIKFKLE